MVLGWLNEDVMLGKLIEHVDAFKIRRKAGKPEPALQTARRPRPPTPAQRTWLQTGYTLATNWLQTGYKLAAGGGSALCRSPRSTCVAA